MQHGIIILQWFLHCLLRSTPLAVIGLLYFPSRAPLPSLCLKQTPRAAGITLQKAAALGNSNATPLGDPKAAPHQHHSKWELNKTPDPKQAKPRRCTRNSRCLLLFFASRCTGSVGFPRAESALTFVQPLSSQVGTVPQGITLYNSVS